jgi:hypothetical protein
VPIKFLLPQVHICLLLLCSHPGDPVVEAANGSDKLAQEADLLGISFTVLICIGVQGCLIIVETLIQDVLESGFLLLASFIGGVPA